MVFQVWKLQRWRILGRFIFGGNVLWIELGSSGSDSNLQQRWLYGQFYNYNCSFSFLSLLNIIWNHRHYNLTEISWRRGASGICPHVSLLTSQQSIFTQ